MEGGPPPTIQAGPGQPAAKIQMENTEIQNEIQLQITEIQNTKQSILNINTMNSQSLEDVLAPSGSSIGWAKIGCWSGYVFS